MSPLNHVFGLLLVATTVLPTLAADPTAINADVLEIAYAYEDGGEYEWKGSGTPEELRFGGEQILPKGEGTFCCGYTLAVVFKAADSRGLLEGRTPDDVRLLHKYWYGNSDESQETLVQYALEELGLGVAVELDDAQAGDFLQFWRTSKSGHSVIFLEWIVEEGKRVGVKYRSSQKLTKGIGDRVEYFADADGHEGKLTRDRFYLVRLKSSTDKAIAQSNDGNWPQWRGPAANAVVPAGDYPIEFSPTKNVLWQVDLGGEGSNTPVVWGDALYLTLTAAGQDVLVSYTLDGTERWRRALGTARAGKHATATGSNSSAVTDGKHVVAYFKSGLVACFDTAGNEKWRVNLQDKYGKDTLWWDLGTSPVLTSAGVCIAVMQEGDSYLVTLSIDTGDVVWKQSRTYADMPEESDQAYTTPAVVNIAGQEIIVTWGADHLTGHDAKTGNQVWECGGFNPKNERMWRVIASATVVDGMAYVQYGRSDFIACVRVSDAYEDCTETNRVWQKRGVGADVASPVVAGGKVYVLGDKGLITCLDAKSGDELWSGQLPRGKSKYFSSPLLAGKNLYCLRNDGMLFVASVDGKLELLAENDLEEDAVATLVPVGDTLLMRTRTKLYRFGSLEVTMKDLSDIDISNSSSRPTVSGTFNEPFHDPMDDLFIELDLQAVEVFVEPISPIVCPKIDMPNWHPMENYYLDLIVY